MDDSWQPPQPSSSLGGGLQWNLFQGNQHAIAASHSTFSKPRPSRVMKPRSAGNSPSSIARRPGLVPSHGHVTQHPLSTPNHQDYQSNLAAASSSSSSSSVFRPRRSRPVSWHPTSARDFNGYFNLPPYMSVQQQQQQQQQSCHPAISIYEEGNLPSYTTTTSNVPASNQFFLSNINGNDNVPPIQQQTSPLQMDDSQFSWGIPPPPPTTTIDGLPTFSQQSIPSSATAGWPFDMTSMDMGLNMTMIPSSASIPNPDYENIQSSSSNNFANPLTSTSDFLPTSTTFRHHHQLNTQSQPLPNRRRSEDELVGMGIYSNQPIPEERSHLGISGKGLKLEETFTPSSNHEREDQDADIDDDEDSASSITTGTDSDEEEDDDDDDDDDDDATTLSQSNQELSETTLANTAYLINSRHQQSEKPVEVPQKPFFDVSTTNVGDGDDTGTGGGIQDLINGSQQLLNLGNNHYQSCMNYGYYGWF